MTMHQNSKGPLDGITVLDLTRVMSGPFGTMILADLGAEVIKIEEPSSGDETRHWGPPFAEGESAYFMSVNRNKKSVTANLKDQVDKEEILRLAASCDVLVENFRPGVANRLGLGYEELSKENPSLIYASISGFGQTGPLSDRAGYDPIMQARSGLMSITGEQDGSPSRVGVAISDLSAAMWAVIGILAALQERTHSHKGQHIDVSLFDAQISLLTNVAGSWFMNGKEPQRYGTGHPTIVPSRAYEASDGLLMVAIGNDRMFRRFVEALGSPEELLQERFVRNPDRVTHRDELEEIIEQHLRTKTRQEWDEIMSNWDVPASPVNSVSEALQEEHLQARNMVVDLEHAVAGRVKSLASPIQLSRTPITMRSAPPTLGQDNHSVFNETFDHASRVR